MKTNSIRQNMSKDDIISSIKLLLGDDIKKEKAYFIVEGDDDVKFMNKFCNKDNVVIYESHSGKYGVEDIINSNVLDSERVIGIRDKDYCQTESSNRIFFYDKCCLEMMIISFDESFKNLSCEYYKGKLNFINLKQHILSELYKISLIRKYNEENKKEIKFDGLSISSMIDADNKLDEKKLINALKLQNSKLSFNFVVNINKSKSPSIKELLNITNGHDFIYFFQELCNREVNRKYNDTAISSGLRISFNTGLFSKTILYNNINNYFGNKINIWNF